MQFRRAPLASGEHRIGGEARPELPLSATAATGPVAIWLISLPSAERMATFSDGVTMQ
jgi:hypothetical protein